MRLCRLDLAGRSRAIAVSSKPVLMKPFRRGSWDQFLETMRGFAKQLDRHMLCLKTDWNLEPGRNQFRDERKRAPNRCVDTMHRTEVFHAGRTIQGNYNRDFLRVSTARFRRGRMGSRRADRQLQMVRSGPCVLCKDHSNGKKTPLHSVRRTDLFLVFK
jgi:hypothetical protein